MSENSAPNNLGAGDELRGATADGRVRRAVLLTAELAEDCATKMFTEHAGGPHSLNIDPVAFHPTVQEIEIGQVAVKAALGEKGSEKRAHANCLCADGLIDLEARNGQCVPERQHSSIGWGHAWRAAQHHAI